MAKVRPEPTDRELEILRVLWELGPSPVRKVHDKLIEDGQEIGYTTALKMMQIMTEKGLLVCDKSAFKHVYKPADSQEKTQKQLVSSLLDKAFAGSAEKLVMRALSAKKVSKEEIRRIQNLLNKMED